MSDATGATGDKDEDEAYEIGVRDGYEQAIQEIDLATGGDGEFRGSTIPGRTVGVSEMKARIIERLRANSWRPIATAPKDGTRILAFGLREKRPLICVTWWRQPEDDAGFVGWGEWNERFWPPTHWMPLPPPPLPTPGQ